LTEPFDRLLALQGRDTAIDQLRHRARAMPERGALRDVSGRLAERESALGAVAEQVEDLAARQRTLEERITATRDRRHELERRMRTGTGYSTRDLQAMDHEINQLAERQAELEEAELTLLEEEEPLDEILAEQRSAVDSLVQEAARLESTIADNESAIGTDIEVQQSARAELAAGLPAELLSRYEVLRERKGGVGAAALVGSRCDGCHLELPAVDLDRIRRLPPDDVVICPECDRILVR
jgi:uncharacterized protein